MLRWEMKDPQSVPGIQRVLGLPVPRCLIIEIAIFRESFENHWRMSIGHSLPELLARWEGSLLDIFAGEIGSVSRTWPRPPPVRKTRELKAETSEGLRPGRIIDEEAIRSGRPCYPITSYLLALCVSVSGIFSPGLAIILFFVLTNHHNRRFIHPPVFLSPIPARFIQHTQLYYTNVLAHETDSKRSPTLSAVS